MGTPGNLVVLDWAGFKAAASYSFDDAQPSHIEHYAALNATGVPLTFYLNTNSTSASGFDSTWTRAASDGHELGNHTVHHCRPDLTGCGGTPLATIDAEIDGCSRYVKDHYGQTCWTMASPFGDGGWIAPARSNSAQSRRCRRNDRAEGQHRSVQSSDQSRGRRRERGGVQYRDRFGTHGRPMGDLSISFDPSDQPKLVRGRRHREHHRQHHHGKSLGDVWIDTVVSVGAYWRAQKLVAAVAPATSGSDTTWTWTLPAHFPPGRYLRVKVDGGTRKQGGNALSWDDHGYYEVALDTGSVTLSP